MNCDVEWSEESGGWKCKRCGCVYKTPKDRVVLATCKAATKLEQVVNYARAVYSHVSTGFQNRSDEQVNDLLEICRQCDSYNAQARVCRICGCRCTGGTFAYVNKLRMGSQHCPLKKW